MKRSLTRSAFYEYIACIALVLECSSVYVNQPQGLFPSANIVLVVGLLPLVLRSVFSFITHPLWGKQALKQLLTFLLICFVYAITLGKQEMLNFSMKFLVIFPMIYLCMIYLFHADKLLEFIKRFILTLCTISWVSLFFWILGPILGLLQPTGSIQYIWGDMTKSATTYFNIQFTTQVEQTFIGLTRNTAFFTEAPKYCLLLVIALCLDCVFFKNKKRETLLFLTMLTTFSFTGIVAFILFLFIEHSLKLFRDISMRKDTMRILTWPALIALGVVVSYALLSAKIATSSGVGRLGDFAVSLSVGIKHPFFGWGFLNNEYLNQVLHYSRLASGVGNTMGLSNSISQVFVDGGIFLTMFYLSAFVFLIIRGMSSKFDSLVALGFVFLFLFFTTYFAYTGVMFFIMSLGFCFHNSLQQTSQVERVNMRYV